VQPSERRNAFDAFDGVGEKLRDRRQALGLSLRKFANSVGVSASFISQLEHGKSQPSVATLYMISNALDIPIAELFREAGRGGASDTDADAATEAVADLDGTSAEVDGPRSASPVVRGVRRRRLELDSGVVWEELSAGDSGVDFLFVSYDVGGSSTPDTRLTRHSGIEYGYIISGTLEITLVFDRYRLEAGDSISFDSSVPHRLYNCGDVPVQAIWFVQGRYAKKR
jgi:transcriptional regulator with XRE-family HTH domain